MLFLAPTTAAEVANPVPAMVVELPSVGHFVCHPRVTSSQTRPGRLHVLYNHTYNSSKEKEETIVITLENAGRNATADMEDAVLKKSAFYLNLEKAPAV